MKTTLLSLVILLSINTAFAQWTTSGTNIYNSNTGNVGIGVTSPTAPLHIAATAHPSLSVGVTGNMANAVTQLSNSLTVIASSNTVQVMNGAVAYDFYNNGTNPSWSGAYMQYNGTGVTGNLYGVSAANMGAMMFQNVTSGVITSNGANIFISPSGAIAASFLANGSVGIGTTNPGSNKLAVEGTIGARRVVVTATNPFPDYVFAPAYTLPSLGTVAEYIRNNGRLPGMPCADSVAKTGLDLGNTQVKLVEKIEELTLYSIALQNKVDALQDKVDELEAANKKLEATDKKLQEMQQEMDELKKLLSK